MYLSLEELLRKIEVYRHKMYALADGKNLADPEVVNMSQQLDRLLNKYTQYQYTSKK